MLTWFTLWCSEPEVQHGSSCSTISTKGFRCASCQSIRGEIACVLGSNRAKQHNVVTVRPVGHLATQGSACRPTLGHHEATKLLATKVLEVRGRVRLCQARHSLLEQLVGGAHPVRAATAARFPALAGACNPKYHPQRSRRVSPLPLHKY